MNSSFLGFLTGYLFKTSAEQVEEIPRVRIQVPRDEAHRAELQAAGEQFITSQTKEDIDNLMMDTINNPPPWLLEAEKYRAEHGEPVPEKVDSDEPEKNEKPKKSDKARKTPAQTDNDK
jgi:hypothetical protein